MTLAEEVFAPTTQETAQEQSVPVLQTERLTLRAPRPSDAKAIALLIGDLRVAVNLLRAPHPYGIDDARQFLASVNKRAGEACFAATLYGKLICVCSVTPRGDDERLVGTGARSWRCATCRCLLWLLKAWSLSLWVACDSSRARRIWLW